MADMLITNTSGSKGNIRPRTCHQCTAVFDGGPRAWYCPECRVKRYKARKAAYRQNGPARPIGSTDICNVCGKTYIVNSGMQQYCKDCAAEALRDIDRKQGLEWYKNNSEEYNIARNSVRKELRKIKKSEKIKH